MWCSKSLNIACESELEAQKNFVRNTTPKITDANIKAGNNCNKTVDEAKEKMDENMRNILSNFSGNKAFWTYAIYANNISLRHLLS